MSEKVDRKHPYTFSDQILGNEDIEAAAKEVKLEFDILNWELDPKTATFYCRQCPDVSSRFDRLVERLKRAGCVAFIDEKKDKFVIRVAKGREEKGGGGALTLKHLVLFSATIITTLMVGASMFNINVLQNPLSIWQGWPYTLAIMGVLGVHESGHYIMSKERGVIATPPYFIPVPFALGTFGAVIRMKSPMPDRKSMFDIGVAGPLLGLAVAIPVTAIGLALSPLAPASSVSGGEFALGKPFFYWLLTKMISPGKGILHPVAFAGWVGFFVTFLNLLPAGQLDGGHIARAFFGRKYGLISGFVPLVLLSLGFTVSFLGANGMIWIFWGFLALIFHNMGHPPPLDDVAPLGVKRRAVGYLVFALMFACFTPVPFRML